MTTSATPPPVSNPRIYLAYDGSINADWVSRYAIRIAANLEDRKITLVHVPDNTFTPESIRLKILAIENACASHAVKLHSEQIPLRRTVFRSLLEAIPPGPENFCICGARITSRRGGFLGGTISEQLLEARKFNVMAIRVVMPGLLGCPDDLLFPLAGHPRGFYTAMPFFHLLAPGIRNLYLLRIMQVNPLLLRYLSRAQYRAIYRRGLDYLDLITREIAREGAEHAIHVDARVILASDWVSETMVQASELRARLILLGATEKHFPATRLRSGKVEELLRKTPCDVAIYRKV
ncbi:MAG: adenine nucleotide alpha hydrolase family protein [Desulfobulbaceae bacterium]